MTPSTDTLTLSNVKARLAAPSPPIFKTLGRILVAIGLAGGSVLTAAIAAPALIPAWIITTSIACVAAGGVGKAITALTVTDPIALQSQQNSLNLPPKS